MTISHPFQKEREKDGAASNSLLRSEWKTFKKAQGLSTVRIIREANDPASLEMTDLARGSARPAGRVFVLWAYDGDQ